MNSCTVSGVKETTERAMPTPVLLTPSARIAVLPGRPPFRLRLKPGTGWPEVTAGSSLPASPETLGAVRARSSTLRLASGTSCIWRSVTVEVVVPDSVFRSGASATTVTCSPTAPASMMTLAVATVAVSTFRLWTVAVLNPCASTVML